MTTLTLHLHAPVTKSHVPLTPQFTGAKMQWSKRDTHTSQDNQYQWPARPQSTGRQVVARKVRGSHRSLQLPVHTSSRQQQHFVGTPRTGNVALGPRPARLAVALPLVASIGVGAAVQGNGAVGPSETSVRAHAGTVRTPATHQRYR